MYRRVGTGAILEKLILKLLWYEGERRANIVISTSLLSMYTYLHISVGSSTFFWVYHNCDITIQIKVYLVFKHNNFNTCSIMLEKRENILEYDIPLRVSAKYNMCMAVMSVSAV